MASKQWKYFEREVANYFRDELGYPNAKRTGPMQGAQQADMDVEGVDGFFIECKWGYRGVITKASSILEALPKMGTVVQVVRAKVGSDDEYFVFHSDALKTISPTMGMTVTPIGLRSWKVKKWYDKALGEAKNQDGVVLCIKEPVAPEKAIMGFYVAMKDYAFNKWMNRK